MMRGKVELLMLMIGLVLFMFDLSSDIFVAVQYIRNSQIWWFVSTVIVFRFSIICITIAAQHQMKSDRLNTCLTYTFLSIFRRYHKGFKQWKRTFCGTPPVQKTTARSHVKYANFTLKKKLNFVTTNINLIAFSSLEYHSL